jgi:hypothetical protein
LKDRSKLIGFGVIVGPEFHEGCAAEFAIAKNKKPNPIIKFLKSLKLIFILFFNELSISMTGYIICR